MSKCAPVILFVYNRPQHAAQALESLAANPLAAESDLIVYADGAKGPEHEVSVQATRDVVHAALGFRSLRVIERDRNIGLAASIISGVTEVCEEYGRAIVVEDDLVLSPAFLAFMNAGLDLYRDDADVMQVSGYMFPGACRDDRPRLLPLTTTWGWGVWQRAWRLLDRDMSSLSLLEADPQLRAKFDLNDAYDYFNMACQQRAGDIDSWGVAWYLSVFVRSGLVLYPGRTLVVNAGFDGSGTHGGGHAPLRGSLAQSHGTGGTSLPSDIADIKVDWESMEAIGTLLRSMKPGILQRAKTVVRRKVANWLSR